jgi:uncharacterized protein (DUF1501 family)
MSDQRAFTRRQFLHDGMCLVSATATLPLFLQDSAFALAQPGGQTSSRPGVPDERILVVIQLGGGNDGLNTVAPIENDAYHRARPQLALRPQDALMLGRDGTASGLALHPSLTGLKDLYDDGQVGVLLGVGYPNPNRSHFKSMDIWHTADRSGTGRGWLGRYFDNTCEGAPDPDAAIAIGREAPLALHGKKTSAVTFENADMFRWRGKDYGEPLAEAYDEFNRRPSPPADVDTDSNLAFLMRTSLDAQLSSEQINAAVKRETRNPYPNSKLGRDLRLVAQMISAGLSTKVYYVDLGGFDTHAGQAGTHARLLQTLGDAVRAFQKDLTARGESERVLTMTFSEFGRRVGQNGSGGTDHGTAAPMFVIGDQVRAGVWGAHPSLTDLDNGDLIYTVDFRSVYAGVLEDWFRIKSQPILQGTYRPAQVVDSR